MLYRFACNDVISSMRTKIRPQLRSLSTPKLLKGAHPFNWNAPREFSTPELILSWFCGQSRTSAISVSHLSRLTAVSSQPWQR